MSVDRLLWKKFSWFQQPDNWICSFFSSTYILKTIPQYIVRYQSLMISVVRKVREKEEIDNCTRLINKHFLVINIYSCVFYSTCTRHYLPPSASFIGMKTSIISIRFRLHNLNRRDCKLIQIPFVRVAWDTFSICYSHVPKKKCHKINSHWSRI